MKKTPLITFALLGLALAVQQATAASILEDAYEFCSIFIEASPALKALI